MSRAVVARNGVYTGAFRRALQRCRRTAARVQEPCYVVVGADGKFRVRVESEVPPREYLDICAGVNP